MRQIYKWIVSALAVVSLITTSCVDEIKFGNSFLDKAPGGSPSIPYLEALSIHSNS